MASTALPVTATVILATPSPALAAVSAWRGSGLSGLQVLGIYVGGPLALFLLIGLLLVVLPAWASGFRNRAEESAWTGEPAWFDGPAEGQEALRVTEPSDEGGGASAGW